MIEPAAAATGNVAVDANDDTPDTPDKPMQHRPQSPGAGAARRLTFDKTSSADETNSVDSALDALQQQDRSSNNRGSSNSGSGTSGPADAHPSHATPAAQGAGVAAVQAGGDVAQLLPQQASGDGSNASQRSSADAETGLATAAVGFDNKSCKTEELEGSVPATGVAAPEQQVPTPEAAQPTPTAQTDAAAATAAAAQGEEAAAAAAAAQPEAAAAAASQAEAAAALAGVHGGPEEGLAVEMELDAAAPAHGGAAADQQPLAIAADPASAAEGAGAGAGPAHPVPQPDGDLAVAQAEVAAAGAGAAPQVQVAAAAAAAAAQAEEAAVAAGVDSGPEEEQMEVDAAAPAHGGAAADQQPLAVSVAADAPAAPAAAYDPQLELVLAAALLEVAVKGLYERFMFEALHEVMHAMLRTLCPFLEADGQQTVHDTATAMLPALLPVMQQHSSMAVLASAALFLRHLRPDLAAGASMAWLAPCAEVVPYVHGAAVALGHLARLATDAVAHEYGVSPAPADEAAQAASAAATAVTNAYMGAALQAELAAHRVLIASAVSHALREVCAAVLLLFHPGLPQPALHAGVQEMLPQVLQAVGAGHSSLPLLMASASLLGLLAPGYAAHANLNWLMQFSPLMGFDPAAVSALRHLAVSVLVAAKRLTDGTWGGVVMRLLMVDRAILAGCPPGGLQHLAAAWTWPAELQVGPGQVVWLGTYPTQQAAHQARYSMAVALAADGEFDLNDLAGLQHHDAVLFDINEDLTPSVQLLVNQHHLAML